MHFTKNEIAGMDSKDRLKLINAVSGIKPANLIGTISDEGMPNLAIFSSVVHLGSDPALLGFILRPVGAVPRHTYENILQNNQYTINHVHRSFIKKAHYTSAKLERNRSEFETCGLRAQFLPSFKAPFVQESLLKMGMQFLEAIPIPRNGTLLVIGEIQHLVIPEIAIDSEGEIDLMALDGIGISGLNTYYGLKKLDWFPYARAEDLSNIKF
jgi:flavin reductase (DIM6/NTAB) family NADH-FMN oxidoreductase RutF